MNACLYVCMSIRIRGWCAYVQYTYIIYYYYIYTVRFVAFARAWQLARRKIEGPNAIHIYFLILCAYVWCDEWGKLECNSVLSGIPVSGKKKKKKRIARDESGIEERSIYTWSLLMYMKNKFFFLPWCAAYFISAFFFRIKLYVNSQQPLVHKSLLDINRLPSEFFPE